MNAQGQKTGGRQKGTPNKITASVKYMFKALMMNNYDLVEDSFQKAKPNERLNFIAKMTPFICAKEQPGKNGGEWVMDQSMDHEWFQIYETDHLLRRKQRIQFEENYAAQDLNCRHQFEYELITNTVKTAMKAGMEKEDLIKIVGREFEAFYADMREDKIRLKENFRQRRENFQKIEQEFLNEENADDETEEVVKEEASQQSDEPAQPEESTLQPVEETQNNDIPTSRCPDNQHLNSSTLDPTTSPNEADIPFSKPSTLTPKPNLNPSTLDNKSSAATTSKPNIRFLKQKQRRPFYTAITSKRRRR